VNARHEIDLTPHVLMLLVCLSLQQQRQLKLPLQAVLQPLGLLRLIHLFHPQPLLFYLQRLVLALVLAHRLGQDITRRQYYEYKRSNSSFIVDLRRVFCLI
jgi:hypothetical protein